MLPVSIWRGLRRCERSQVQALRFSAYPAYEADSEVGSKDREEQGSLDDRRQSSKAASSSGTSARWQEMQKALHNHGHAARRRQLPSAAEVQQALRAPESLRSSAMPAAESRSYMSWQEVLAAARFVRKSSLEDKADALQDTFGRRHTYLRISLTERCNLRCLYCMPEEGAELTPAAELLTAQEILRLAQIFVAAGVTKIRLTGGEPTLRGDIVDLAASLHSLPGLQRLGITTNGIALRRKLKDLHASGVTLLNISLDTLRPERFEKMTRRKGLERVLDTIHAAVSQGFNPVKVNVVVMRGVNDDEICDFVELTRNQPINVRFIEYMPFDGNVWSREKMVSFRDMLQAISEKFPGGLQPLQDPSGEVAKNYSIDGFKGTVSFITSMTKAFCGDCNRLRLMADGNLKVCLFGANEVSLRDAMREGASDEELLAIVSAAVDRKKAAHAGMFELSRSKNRAMVHIGG